MPQQKDYPPDGGLVPKPPPEKGGVIRARNLLDVERDWADRTLNERLRQAVRMLAPIPGLFPMTEMESRGRMGQWEHLPDIDLAPGALTGDIPGLPGKPGPSLAAVTRRLNAVLKREGLLGFR